MITIGILQSPRATGSRTRRQNNKNEFLIVFGVGEVRGTFKSSGMQLYRGICPCMDSENHWYVQTAQKTTLRHWRGEHDIIIISNLMLKIT